MLRGQGCALAQACSEREHFHDPLLLVECRPGLGEAEQGDLWGNSRFCISRRRSRRSRQGIPRTGSTSCYPGTSSRRAELRWSVDAAYNGTPVTDSLCQRPNFEGALTLDSRVLEAMLT